MRAELAGKIAAHARTSGEHPTAISGLTLYRLTASRACEAAEYETGLAAVVQGRTRVTLGTTTYVWHESKFLLTSLELRVERQDSCLFQTCHNIIDSLCRPVAPFGSGGLGVTICGVPFPS